MFPLLEKIDKGLESKTKCKVVDKMGRYYNGVFEDSWVRYSGGKLRGKVVFQSDEKGRVEIDANDILEILLPGPQSPGAKK
jgi:hypothetical protein